MVHLMPLWDMHLIDEVAVARPLGVQICLCLRAAWLAAVCACEVEQRFGAFLKLRSMASSLAVQLSLSNRLQQGAAHATLEGQSLRHAECTQRWAVSNSDVSWDGMQSARIQP